MVEGGKGQLPGMGRLRAGEIDGKTVRKLDYVISESNHATMSAHPRYEETKKGSGHTASQGIMKATTNANPNTPFEQKKIARLKTWMK